MPTAIGADEASNVTNEPATTVAETVVKAGLNSNVILVEPEDAVLNDIENRNKKA